MAEPRLEDDAETSKSTVHEAGGLERMMDDRGDEDISEEDLRLDDRFLDEEFLEDDGEEQRGGLCLCEPGRNLCTRRN